MAMGMKRFALLAHVVETDATAIDSRLAKVCAEAFMAGRMPTETALLAFPNDELVWLSQVMGAENVARHAHDMTAGEHARLQELLIEVHTLLTAIALVRADPKNQE